jgi:phospholipid-binding lipoprotein MlaA
MLAGCATTRTPSPADPLELVNRPIFTFNDTIDRYAFRPVAQAYNWALPQFVRNSVSNVFSNIGDVYTAANEFLQGKVTDGTQDVMRVTINTLFGLGGLFDVATQARLPKHQQDFGLTLAHYGVPSGPYLVLPLFGPSTLRDSAGFLVDRYADPTTYIDPVYMRNVLYGIRLVNARAALLNASDLLADAALDKYSFVRNAYLQRRDYLISQDKRQTSSGNGDGGLPVYTDPESGATGGATGGGAAAEGLPVYEDPDASATGAAAARPGATNPASGADNSGTGNQVLPPLNVLPNLRLR